MQRNWLNGLGFTALCISLALGVSACSRQDAAHSDAPPAPALKVVPVKPQTLEWPDTLVAQGSIAPWHEAVVGAEVAGLRITEVRVDVGAVVQRGQVLATLHEAPVRADLAAAQAQWAQARAGLVEAQAAALEAQANAERARAVESGGALSAQQIAQYQTAAQTAQARQQAAQAQLESAQARVAAQQLRLQMTQVRAPDAGVVSARSAQLGAVVSVGQELFRVVRGQRLEWRAELSAAELARVQRGQVVRVRSAAGDEVRGVVRQIGPVLDPHTRNALVYVDLPVGAPVKAGMYAQGELVLGRRLGWFVPQSAVVVREGLAYVWVLDGDRVVQRKVRTGRQADERIEIVEGLSPDTELVGQGAGFLNDGDLVARVTDPAAPATGSAP